MSVGGADLALSAMSQWAGAHAPKRVGLWHLLTDCFPRPGTVGIAWQGSMCSGESAVITYGDTSAPPDPGSDGNQDRGRLDSRTELGELTSDDRFEFETIQAVEQSAAARLRPDFCASGRTNIERAEHAPSWRASDNKQHKTAKQK